LPRVLVGGRSKRSLTPDYLTPGGSGIPQYRTALFLLRLASYRRVQYVTFNENNISVTLAPVATIP